MALLYPWATKDYLLWEMTIGQIIMYHNLGLELKYGKQDERPRKPSEMSHAELKELKKEIREQYYRDEERAELKRKYGDI